jgi:Mn-containing catalase
MIAHELVTGFRIRNGEALKDLHVDIVGGTIEISHVEQAETIVIDAAALPALSEILGLAEARINASKAAS